MLNKGYGILPNTVLFDENLSSSAKLLFVYISSLCAVEGYCWASNKHFAQRFGVSESQVSRLIAALGEYIRIEKGVNQYRIIKLNDSNLPTQKAQGGISKNAYHNSTRGIKKLNKENNTGSNSKLKYKTPDELGMPVIGDDFYENYYKSKNDR